jgi:LemA protein
MSKTQKTLLIVGGVVLILILIPYGFFKGTYNSLVRLDEGVKGAWAQVENQLQRRYDLIPNYVETVKGYAAHEKEVLVGVTEARSKVAGAGSLPDKMAANNQLSSALARLMVVVERYPDLKANTNFIRLQDELAGTENRIAVERRRFNETVKTYNIKLRTFPTVVVAGMFGF